MSDLRVFGKQLSISRQDPNSANWVAGRGLVDGTLVEVPWYQALVFEGRVFGINAGTITTPIAGHAAIDADQPEAAVFIAAAGTAALPLFITAAMETGATTLATGGMMAAVSNISVGAGTSTAATPFNLKFTGAGYSTAATAGVAYTGNGTDPLTAGNFLELKRVGAIVDADAANIGITLPVLEWSIGNSPVAPVVENIGSILLYGEAAANTLFGTIIWAELPETAFD